MELYREFRCKYCEKLLFKGALIESEVEIKCKGCHQLSVFQGEPADKFICMVYPCANRVRVEK